VQAEAAELSDDRLDVIDLESAVLTSELRGIERDSLGRKYVLDGWAADRTTAVGVVCRLNRGGDVVIITVYEITPT